MKRLTRFFRAIKLKTLQARSSFWKRRKLKWKGCTREELEIRFAERVYEIAVQLQLFWSQLASVGLRSNCRGAMRYDTGETDEKY
jgi:hypothetical protein